jgi:cellobiose phosphorylase
VEFRRREQEVDTHTETAASPEDDIELRRIHITNRSRTRRAIEITSYAEVVLAAPAIEGRQVKVEEDSYYDLPGRSEEAASLYEHCVRSILRGLRMGEHGLPLMGSGDRNDGMNLVGEHGTGESVWLGFFLYKVSECGCHSIASSFGVPSMKLRMGWNLPQNPTGTKNGAF